MQIFKNHAEEIADYNLSVMPLNGKKPVLNGWQKYCKEMPTDSEIQRWVSEYPDANIGLCCGPSSGIVAVDVDTTDENMAALIKSIFPPSPAKKISKKGWTWFYTHPGMRKVAIKYCGMSVLDILGDGSQCMIPPSIHPETGKPCTWEGLSLWECLDDLPEFDVKWIDEIKKTLATLGGAIQKGAAPNGRNDTHKKIVSAMYSRGEKIDDIIREIIIHDRNWFPDRPLFSDSTEFAGRDDAYMNAMQFATNIIKAVGDYRISQGKSSKVSVNSAEESKFPHLDSGFYDKDGVPQYEEFCSYVTNKYHFISTDIASFVYDGGIYKSLTSLGVENLIVKLTKNKTKPTQIANFKRLLLARAYQEIDDLEGQVDGLINLSNGILDVKKRKLLSHSPRFFFTYKLDHIYDPLTKCPKWLDYLDFIFQGNKHLIDTSSEIFGYCMSGSSPWLHKSFCLMGSGRNGKSTWLAVLQEMIGSKNFSTVAMDQLNKPFAMVGMYGKLCNIRDESPKGIIDPEAFKTVVGGGYVTAAYKGKDEFQYKPIARLVFSANEVPRFSDSSTGMIERLYFIPFRRYIDVKERVRDFHKKFAGELSGILNWALEGLARLEKRGYLIETETQNEVLDEFRQNDDSVYYWVKNYIEFNPLMEKKWSKEEIFSRYKMDMERDGKRPKNKITFCRDLKNLLPDECDGKTGSSGRFFHKIAYVDLNNASFTNNF